MSYKKELGSLENVKESRSVEKRKRLGSAVDKSALAGTSSFEISKALDKDDAGIQTEDRRKERLCLGLILGILLFLLLALLAGILVASFLLDQKIERLGEDLKIQIGIFKKCVSPNIAFKAAIKKETWTNHNTNDRSFKFEPGAKVIFDEVLLDTSKSYDSTKGVFTCPVSGLYLISLHVGVVSQLAMFALTKDGQKNLHRFGR